MKRLLPALLTGIVVLTGCKPTTATQVCSEEFSNHAATAKEYINAILEENYETASTYTHTEEMQKLILNDEYIHSFEPQLKGLGTLKEIGTPLCESNEEGVTVSIPLKFSNQNVNLNVLFEKDAIAGITVSQYSQ